MRDLELIHPELRLLARLLPRTGPTKLRRLPRWRRFIAASGRLPSRGVDAVDADGVGVRIHRPPDLPEGPQPALLWIHGGGYVMGTAAADDLTCGVMAKRLGVTVAAVEYRLAPEHPYPAAIEDCHRALTWLAGQPDIDESRVAIAGGSAGGGLAAALALLARDRGVVRPVFQTLVYPMIDDRTAARTDIDERGFRLWTNQANALGWRAYLGAPPGGDDIDGIAAPARNPDLTGLPPAWIGVGTLDLFLDENLAYAERLRSAAVPVDLSVVPGAFHGFNVARWTEVARQFDHEMLAATAAGLGVELRD